MADRHGHVAVRRHHVAAGKDAGVTGHHLRVHLHHAVFHGEPRNALDQRQVDVLAQRQHHRVGLERLELARGLREALLVQRHLLHRDGRFAGLLDRGQPLDHHAFLQRLFHLEVVRRHLLAVAPVDDDGLGRTQPLGRARHVDRGVAATIDHHLATQHGLVLALHGAQHRDRVEHLGRVAGRDEGALGDMRAHRQKHRVKAALQFRVEHVGDLAVVVDHHAQVDDALHLGVEHVARQPVLRNAKAHHAAGQRSRLVHRDLVALARELVGGGQARGPRAHDQHLLARGRRRRRQLPALGDALIPQEAFHRVDAHGRVHLGAVAGALAAVVADPAHDGRERVVLHEHAPGLLVLAGLGVKQPGLDVLAGRALVVARRQPVQVDRARGAPASGVVRQRAADVQGDGKGFLHEGFSLRDQPALRLARRSCPGQSRWAGPAGRSGGCCGPQWPAAGRW